MAVLGLLASPADTVFVELAAGKGWLSAWLAGQAGARRLLLLDRSAGLKNKVRALWRDAPVCNHQLRSCLHDENVCTLQAVA